MFEGVENCEREYLRKDLSLVAFFLEKKKKGKKTRVFWKAQTNLEISRERERFLVFAAKRRDSCKTPPVRFTADTLPSRQGERGSKRLFRRHGSHLEEYFWYKGNLEFHLSLNTS